MRNMKLILFSLALLFLALPETITAQTLFDRTTDNKPKIFVNNRILAKVNGKVISTLDLMKKLDLSFFREYPQYAESVTARYQYYQMAWKSALDEMIDKELVLADAKESKIEVSSGDVRQEMESSFGPNIIANLDKIGMSFDEATKIITEEIIMRRMISGRVHSKALRQVTPIKIKTAYEDFSQDANNFRSTQWIYKVLTIKDPSLQKSEEISKNAYTLLKEGVPLSQIPEELKTRKYLTRKSVVSVSNSIESNEQELSENYKRVLSPLDNGMYSEPFPVRSRTSRATVYRILFAEKKTPGGLPSYQEMENILKNRLLDNTVDQETNEYLEKLRKHYHILRSDIDALLPANYEPFTL